MENMNKGQLAPSAPEEGKREQERIHGLECDNPWCEGFPISAGKPLKKRVLWLSRHAPTKGQTEELKRILGACEIIQVSKTVNNGKEVKDLMRENQCDELVAVLPLNILQQVISQGIQPIRAVMQREVRDDGSVEFYFQHFERVLEVMVKTKKLGRLCNCGSGEPWFECRRGSSYCG